MIQDLHEVFDQLAAQRVSTIKPVQVALSGIAWIVRLISYYHQKRVELSATDP